jgi:hypothetical protein
MKMKMGSSWKTKTDDVCFKTVRAGDHLMVLFQCELCHFRNVMKQDPEKRNAADQKFSIS